MTNLLLLINYATITPTFCHNCFAKNKSGQLTTTPIANSEKWSDMPVINTAAVKADRPASASEHVSGLGTGGLQGSALPGLSGRRVYERN